MSQESHILLFEDDRTLRTLIRFAFERLGYTVEAHEDPHDFMSGSDVSSRLRKFSGIWTDGTMIRMHGNEAAHAARENGFLGPIALCSGNDLTYYLQYQHPDYVAGNWRGPLFDALHAKPIFLPQLERAIRDFKEHTPRTPQPIYTT